MSTQNTKFIISGDSSGFVKAAQQAQTVAKNLGSSFGELQSIAAKGLAITGVSFGTAELVKMADEYGQLSVRLQLATRFSGDYEAVQKSLARTADETRSSLKDTVELYTRLSPALQATGRNSAQSISIISTVNKAIALSGVSAEAAAAGITQFGQALGAGKLSGDELNSILESTPGLADAIAEGLGKTRGELKQLGADGKLTANVVVEALERVRERVDADFAKLPISVSQAFTKFGNTITTIVGETSMATGAMGSLARAVIQVGDGIKAFADTAGPAIRPVVVFITEAVDGVSRLVRIAGSGLGALGAAAAAAIRGNFSGAKEIVKQFGEDVQSILLEPLQREQIGAQIVADEKEKARQRLDLEKKLAEKKAELAKMTAVVAGEASSEILMDDKARTDEQLKNAEKLRDALRSAWQTSVEEAKRAGEEAATLLQKAADIRQTGADRAAAKRRGALTPDQQQKEIVSEFERIQSDAELNAAAAANAAMFGRAKEAEKYAAQAARDAERAGKLAEQIDNPEAGASAIERNTETLAQLAEAQARIKQKEQTELEQRAAAQQQTIVQLDKQIAELAAKAAAIKIGADISAAENAIKGLSDQLDQLQAKASSIAIGGVAPSGGESGAGFAYGGYTGPGGKWQPAGIVHAGEFVLRQEVVRQRGALEFLSRFNRVGLAALKGYATGGLVSRMPMPSAGAAGRSGGAQSPVTLNFPGVGSFAMQASSDVVGELKTALAREVLKRGSRK